MKADDVRLRLLSKPLSHDKALAMCRDFLDKPVVLYRRVYEYGLKRVVVFYVAERLKRRDPSAGRAERYVSKTDIEHPALENSGKF